MSTISTFLPYHYITTLICASILIPPMGLQVTRSVDTARNQLSPQEKKTVEAIVKAR